MFVGIQAVGILFALGMIYLSFIYYKRKTFTIIELGYWTLLWLMFLYVLFFPDNINIILKFLHIARTMDFFMIVAFVILFGVVFHNYAVTRVMDKKLEELVQRLALEKVKKEKH